MIKPKALKEGDTIGIVAPGGAFDAEPFGRGVKRIEELGFRVKVYPEIFNKKRYFAGDDNQRLNVLMNAFSDPEVKAIMCARGGYGTQRLIPRLNQGLIKKNPKPFVGYSDITIFLSFLQKRCKMICIHGPVVAGDLGNDPKPITLSSLKKSLTLAKPLGKISGNGVRSLNNFKAKGELTGGCLSLLVFTVGTPYEIETDGKILFLEEVNEKPYSIDRMLNFLKTLGKFKKIKGVVFGRFIGCSNGEGDQTAQQVIEEVIAETFYEYKIPILLDFPAGHGKEQLSLPFGVKVEVDGVSGSVTFLESALR